MPFYAEQYGVVWSLSRQEMFNLLKGGMATGSHDLTPYRKLSRRPKRVLKDRGEPDHYTIDMEVFLISPLDFERDDYEYHLQRLIEFF